MSLSEFTIAPAAAASEAKPAAVSRPASPAGSFTFNEGKFKPADGNDGPRHEIREGGGAPARAIPAETLAKLGAKWTEQAPAAEAKPAEGAAPAEAAKTETPTADATKPDPAKPAEAPVPSPDDIKAIFGDRKPADVKAELDRYLEHNRKLAAELEEARKPKTSAARGKLDDAADTYVDDSVGAVRRLIAHSLGYDDPDHADVTAELTALTSDLTAKQFGVQLDAAQQAARDAAKARQALARDKRSRKAESDAATNDPGKSEAEAAKRATEFIGNRLVAQRTGPDGKALPPLKEQFPLAAAMAARTGRSLEDQIFDAYRRELPTGRFDPQRLHDDDYLISEAGKILEAHYQDLADTLGKARPTPSTAQPKPPATAPAAATSESQGQPQSHGGRTALTAADSSVAPATPLTAPTTTQKRRPSRDEFLDRHYPRK